MAIYLVLLLSRHFCLHTLRACERLCVSQSRYGILTRRVTVTLPHIVRHWGRVLLGLVRNLHLRCVELLLSI